jgi:glucose/arabinose dehydrogenase
LPSFVYFCFDKADVLSPSDDGNFITIDFTIHMIKLKKQGRLFTLFTFLIIVIIACEDNSSPENKPVIWRVTTITGSGQGFMNGSASIAKFNLPIGLAISTDNKLLIADYENNRLRSINSDNLVSTEAGTGSAGYYDGPVDVAQFDEPYGIAVVADGTVYVTDRSSSKIRKISNGIVSTLAGGIGGNSDGTGSQAGFNIPSGIAVGIDGSLFVADRYNNSIRKITTDGVVTTYAGSKATLSGYKDGFRTEALFDQPIDICVGPDGALYVAEYDNHTIRKISLDGTVSTFAGNGQYGNLDGNGSRATFYFPSGIAISTDGTLYVADEGNNRIREISKSGHVTTIAGSSRGNADGDGMDARFFGPLDIIVSADGSLIVSDSNNHRICKIAPQK